VTRIIYTDINRDGTKSGVDYNKLKKIASIIKIPLVVSGGVANITDIKKLYKASSFEGVIIGRAIYDNSISLDQLSKFI
jgi:phosphoribosylformimino-5-aminoimidazole carboxamide ribotide isomerase